MPAGLSTAIATIPSVPWTLLVLRDAPEEQNGDGGGGANTIGKCSIGVSHPFESPIPHKHSKGSEKSCKVSMFDTASPNLFGHEQSFFFFLQEIPLNSPRNFPTLWEAVK